MQDLLSEQVLGFELTQGFQTLERQITSIETLLQLSQVTRLLHPALAHEALWLLANGVKTRFWCVSDT